MSKSKSHRKKEPYWANRCPSWREKPYTPPAIITRQYLDSTSSNTISGNPCKGCSKTCNRQCPYFL